MLCKTDDELNEFVEMAKKTCSIGKVADYIPALAEANPEHLSVAIYYPDEELCISAGNVNDLFTLQSISKVLTLALALVDHGQDYVFSRVGMEPTGDPFNSIVKLEMHKPSRPLNPMINAGALAVTDMIKGRNVDEKFNRILDFVHQLTGNGTNSFNEKVAKSEFDTAYLNRALCFFMKEHNGITMNVEDLLDVYTKQCAIEMNCSDLAKIGAVFALDGIDPKSGRRILPVQVARICKTFMVTCGMYNASGEFAIKVGIPAKSGVAGGILCAVPGKYGIGVYGPALDDKGNSVAGIELLKRLAERYDFNMYS